MLKTEKLKPQLGPGGKRHNSFFGLWCFKLSMIGTSQSVGRYLSLQILTNQQHFVTTLANHDRATTNKMKVNQLVPLSQKKNG